MIISNPTGENVVYPYNGGEVEIPSRGSVEVKDKDLAKLVLERYEFLDGDRSKDPYEGVEWRTEYRRLFGKEASDNMPKQLLQGKVKKALDEERKRIDETKAEIFKKKESINDPKALVFIEGQAKMMVNGEYVSYEEAQVHYAKLAAEEAQAYYESLKSKLQ